MAESFRDKLSKLTETHLFWSGGIAMIFVAISLAPEHRTFSIICLVIAWLILTISIYKHGFFERRAKWAQFVYNALASLFIGGILSLVWFALLPESATTLNPDDAVGPSWLREHVSAGWNYFKYAATWLLPYATGFVIALLLINAKRFFSKFNVRPQPDVREQMPPLLDFAELIRNLAGRPVNMICDKVGPVEVGQSDPSRSKSDSGSSALVAEFVDDVDPERPSKSVSGVYARIDYETAQGSNAIRIHKGCWIGKRINYASFNVGDARSLILAQQWSDGTVCALDNNWQASNSMAEPTRVPLTADEYVVTVRLYTLPTSLGMVMDFKFRLTLKPEIAISMISATSPDEKQLCPDRKLHEIAENDKLQIAARLRIIGVKCITHLGKVPFVEFVFGVYNIALVSVSIDDPLDGQIIFYEDRKNEGLSLSRAPTMGSNLAKNCLFRGTHQFSIRQEVSPEEAAFIERSPDDSSFFLGDLRITMHGDGFDGVRLETPFTVDKNGYCWRDPSMAVFGDTESQTALHEKKLAELERQHRAEMKRERSRFDTIQTLSIVYGAAIQLDEQLLSESSPSRAKHSIEVWQGD